MKDYSGKRIAIIDDDKINLNIARIKLKPYNFIIDEGASMAELFKLMTFNEYDLLILDDMMPIMTGTQAMQKLKTEGYLKPIIVLTGNVEDPSAKENYMKAGFDEFLGKPINNEQLNNVLIKFLG